MMKIYLLLPFVLIFSISFVQKLNDKFEYKVTYKLTYKLDSTARDEYKSEYMVLYTGHQLSKFSSRAKTLSNPIVRKINSASTSRAALTQFHYEILKEKQSGNSYYTLQMPKLDDRFYYFEKMDQLEWDILPETKRIEDYDVQKATTSFAGRDYIAWFTPEIPIAEGPYKFNGLPGLILEIADTKEQWVFEFFGLEKLSPKIFYRLNLNKFAKTNKKQLQDLWYRYRRDPFSYSNNPNITISPEVHKKYVISFTEMLEKENNPIELK